MCITFETESLHELKDTISLSQQISYVQKLALIEKINSFNGFDAIPLHDVSRLGSRLERRAEIAQTTEFQVQRMKTSVEGVKSLIMKTARSDMRKTRESI